jgi:hypothetical protein
MSRVESRRREPPLPLSHTLAWLFVAVAFAAFCGWRGSRLPDPRRGARMAPYRFLMLMSVCAALLLLVHLVNLAGVPTGRP